MTKKFKIPQFLVILAFCLFMLPIGPTALAASANDQAAFINVQIILINFANKPDQPFSRQELQNRLFDYSNSLDNYFSQVSYGKAKLAGKVFGWYTLPQKQTCQPTEVFTPAIQAARADSSFVEGQRTIIIAPFGPDYCGWVGYAAGYSHLIAIDSDTQDLPRVVAHELGHDLGLLHASSLNCNSNSQISLSDCAIDEYGDAFDMMGKNAPGLVDFNAAQKEYLNWLEPGNVQAVTQSGTFTLAPMSASNGLLKALKIPRRVNEYLYVEYRQPQSFNIQAGFINNPFAGALLHIANPGIPKTYLVTALPDINSAVLPVNKSFVDPLTGTVIEALSQTSAGLTVRVTLGSRVWALGLAEAATVSLRRAGFLPSGTLVLDRGTVFMIDGQNKRAFSNLPAFLGLGYGLKNAVPADTSGYALASPLITSAKISHPPGSWVLSNKTVYYAGRDGFIPVPSWQVFLNNGGRAETLVKANSYDLQALQKQPFIAPMSLADGRLK